MGQGKRTYGVWNEITTTKDIFYKQHMETYLLFKIPKIDGG